MTPFSLPSHLKNYNPNEFGIWYCGPVTGNLCTWSVADPDGVDSAHPLPSIKFVQYMYKLSTVQIMKDAT